MKKLVLFLSACALLASAVWVDAAGDAGDPLASLSYLNGEFSQRAEKKSIRHWNSQTKIWLNVWKTVRLARQLPPGRRPAQRG